VEAGAGGVASTTLKTSPPPSQSELVMIGASTLINPSL